MVQRDRLLTAIVSRLPMPAAVNFQQLISRRLLLGVKESGGRVAGSLWYRRQGGRGDFEELLARGSARRLHRDALRDRGEIAGQR